MSHTGHLNQKQKAMQKPTHVHGVRWCLSLTSMPSWTASIATWASGSGSPSASFSAFAALAFPIFPRHTRATSRRRVFTHIRAMFSHTALLQGEGEKRRARKGQRVAHCTGILLFITIKWLKVEGGSECTFPGGRVKRGDGFNAMNKNVTSCTTTCKELLLVISQFYCNLCFHTVNCLLATFLSEFMFD